MRYTYRHIGILTISLIVASCSFSQKQADNNHDKDMNPNVKIVVLDPGHFHASQFGYMLPKERKSNNI